MSLKRKRKTQIKEKELEKVLLCSAIFFLFGIAVRKEEVLIAVILAMNLYCVIKSWKNDMMLVICGFMAWSNWSVLAFFWMHDMFPFSYDAYFWIAQFQDTMYHGLNCIYIMSAVIFSFFPKVMTGVPMQTVFIAGRSKSNVKVWGFILGIIALFFWRVALCIRLQGFTESSVYEYIIVLFILGYYYSGNCRLASRILTLLLMLNVVFIVINGDRGLAVELAVVLFTVSFNNRIPKACLVFMGLIAIIGLNAVGMWRNLSQFDISFIIKSVKVLFETGAVLDTAYSAGASGLIITKLANDYSLFGRWILFVKFIMTIFAGSSAVGLDSNLVWLGYWEYPYATGGGILPYYGFFYLGYIGVALLGIVVAKYISMIAGVADETNDLKKCISVYIACTVANWYLYTPLPLFRGVLLLSLVYMISRLRWDSASGRISKKYLLVK